MKPASAATNSNQSAHSIGFIQRKDETDPTKAINAKPDCQYEIKSTTDNLNHCVSVTAEEI